MSNCWCLSSYQATPDVTLTTQVSWVDKFLASGMTAVAAASHPPTPQSSTPTDPTGMQTHQPPSTADSIIPSSAQTGTSHSKTPESISPFLVSATQTASAPTSPLPGTYLQGTATLKSKGASATDLRSKLTFQPADPSATAATPGAALEQLSLGGGVSRMSQLNRVSSCAATAIPAYTSTGGRSDPGAPPATTTAQPTRPSNLESVQSQSKPLTNIMSSGLNAESQAQLSQHNLSHTHTSSQRLDPISSQQSLPQGSSAPVRRALTSTPSHTQSASLQPSLGRALSSSLEQGGSSQNLKDHTKMSLLLQVGVLHYSPSLEPFPLLADPSRWAERSFAAAPLSGTGLPAFARKSMSIIIIKKHLASKLVGAAPCKLIIFPANMFSFPDCSREQSVTMDCVSRLD